MKIYGPGYLHDSAILGESGIVGAMHHIDRDVVIGEDCRIQGQVYICPWVTIGDNVFIAPGVIFTNDRYPPSGKLIKTVIEDNVTIGAGSVIGPGITIGEGSVVGMGSVVVDSVLPNTLVYGNPAVWRGSAEDYRRKQKEYRGDK